MMNELKPDITYIPDLMYSYLITIRPLQLTYTNVELIVTQRNIHAYSNTQ